MWRGLFKGCDSYHSPKPVPGNVLLTRCGEWGGEAGPCCGRVSVVSERWGGSHGGQDVVAFTAVYVQCPRCVQLSRGCSASPVVLSAGSSAAAASRSPTGMCLVYSRHHLSLTSYSLSLFPYFLIFLFHCTLNIYVAHPLVEKYRTTLSCIKSL